MTFSTSKSARHAARAALCAFAVLAVALVSTAVASAADDETGTVVVQQRGPGEAPAKGGCYEVTRTDGATPGFWKFACDGQDAGGKDGNVVVSDLPVGAYRLEEGDPPDAFKPAPGTFSATVGANDTVTVTRVHQPLPPLRVVTTEGPGQAPVAGSCWRIHTPGEYEGYIADACDADDGSNDGTTTFTTIRPGGYEIRHMEAPKPFHRLDDVVPFAMPDADKTLTFTLERATLPVNTAVPTVTGKAAVGETLTGDHGTWTGKFIDYVESWERCDSAGANCLTIPGTIRQSQYTLTAADLDNTLRFAVTAQNEAGRVAAVSAPVDVLSLDAPKNTTVPSITGAIEPGQRLVGNPGTWTGAPTVAYQWQHCAPDGSSCTDIDHATGSTYVLTTGDAAFRLRLVVTATNAAGSATAVSDPTAIPNDDPRNDIQPMVKGTPEVGEQLTAYPGHWITHYGGSLTFDYTWLRCKAADANDCAVIRSASGDVYTVGAADQGMRIRVEVTGTDPGGSATARSNPTLAVPAAYPVNTSPPYVVGDPVILEKLVANAGVWMSYYGSIKLDYSWSRCNADRTGCTTLHTGRNHTVGSKDVGHILRVQVYATNSKGTSSAFIETPVIHEAPPVMLAEPSIMGDAVYTETLTVNPGAWKSPYGDKITINYYWSRCNPDNTGCKYVHTGKTHTVGFGDVGKIMSVMISVETDHGVAIRYAFSPVMHTVDPVMVSDPSIVGDAIYSEKLTVNPGAWSSPYGDPIKFNYYWSRCNPDNTGCKYVHTGKTHTVGFGDVGKMMSVMISVETDHGVAIRYVFSPVMHESPPVMASEPTMSGDAIYSEKLTVNPGAWSSAYGDTIKFNYYWSRCNPDNTGCDYMHTGKTHTVGFGDVGKMMSVMISVETDHGVAIRYVFSPVMHESPPVMATEPTITGDAVYSEKLTVNPGAWSSAYGDTIKFNYYWSRCNPDNTGCEYLHTGKTHTVGFGDTGHMMSVMVSVETDHGVAIRYVFSPVMHEVPPVNVLPPVLNGTAQKGAKLTAAPGVWSSPYGDPIKVNYYWSRCNADGTGCTYLHTGSTHTLGRDDVGHFVRVMLSVETDHGVAIRYVQSDVVS